MAETLAGVPSEAEVGEGPGEGTVKTIKQPDSYIVIDIPGQGRIEISGAGKYVTRIFRRLWMEIDDDIKAVLRQGGRLEVGPVLEDDTPAEVTDDDGEVD